MNKKIHKTGYISDIDKFFQEFDQNREDLPAARKQEVRKHQAIFNRRDNVIEEETPTIWSEF